MDRISDCFEESLYGGLFTTECEKFGMISGCREDCPVFQAGKCEVQEENELLFSKESS